MALFNTIDFLPSVFRTGTNQRFLGATMDQLVTDAVNVPLHGYIGRTSAPTYKITDNYVPESTIQRQNYQLEPGVVITDQKNNVLSNSGYIDLLNGLNSSNGLTNNQQRLFSSTLYNYDGKFDYDKFVNYYNYYWLPNGPASVTVSANDTPYTGNYTITRDTALGGYIISGYGTHPNSQLTLARGGTYTFTVDQPGYKFWIQSEPGTTGVNNSIPTLTTRQVMGVKNNGIDSGTVTFNVPLASAQDFYTTSLTTAATVSVAATFNYSDIQNQLLSSFLKNFPNALDGINNPGLLQGLTFVFINNAVDPSLWTTPTVVSPFTTLDTASIRPGTVISNSTRPSVWTINLVPTGTKDYIIQISPVTTTPVTPKTKVFVSSGNTYAANYFWLNNNLQYQQVPIITANLNYLYYQDSSNPEFTGVIKLVDNISSTIDVDRDILGSISYTSPNGIKFTNGLLVEFDSGVIPSSYANNQYYVEGVGTSIALVPITQLVVPEPFGEDIATLADYITINRASQDLNPWSRSNRWFHKDVIDAVATYNNTSADYGPNIPGRRPIIEFEAGLQLFNFGQQAGNSVTYITFESTDAFADIEGQVTYTLDGNVLKNGDRIIFANDYDNTIINEIWQVVIQNINNSNYITLVETADDPIVVGQNFLVTSGTNAGKTVYYTGSWFTDGEPNICQIKYTANQPPLFDLYDANGYSFSDQTVYPSSTFAGSRLFGYTIPTVTAGNFVTGTTYVIMSVGSTDFTQIGASANEYGISFTATGLGTGTGTAASTTLGDSILLVDSAIKLGLPLTYQNFNNIGDIVFNNYYDTDTFSYLENQSTTTVSCNSGYMVQNNGLDTQTKLNNWVEGLEQSNQFQVFTKYYDGLIITGNQLSVPSTNLVPAPEGISYSSTTEYAFVQIDVLPVTSAKIPHLKVYLNNTLLIPTTDYFLAQVGIYYVIVLVSAPALEDKIDVEIFSNSVSSLGYYEVPNNLDFNPLNENFTTITLGQLRNHYNKLIENTATGSVSIPYQDRNLKSQGGTLLQNKAPLIYAMTFLNDPTVNFQNGINLSRKEYAKFKNKFLSLCGSLPTLNYTDPASSVDLILQNINVIKNNSFPWYYSDMVPQGSEYSLIVYTVSNARQTNYEINSIFDNTVLSNRAILIYLNGSQLISGVDYTFSTTSPAVIFSTTLAVGDVIQIKDYSNTDGNYIPETPTKLGLYPKFTPKIYLDNTYQTPINVIQGHDGSLTPAFGDFRDQFLLELELRIFNNIKANYNNNAIDLYDTLPGRFRTTDYSLSEFNAVMAQNFLSWVGTYNVNFITNSYYDANNPWTWNYSGLQDTVNGSLLQGSWRAIYNYWYDTETPNLTPWEMLGLGDKPTWWTTRYGPAPYTKGNQLLWKDLEAGYIWNNGSPYYDSRFARPGLTSLNGIGFVPVDSAGNLLNPSQIPLFLQYSTQTTGSDFAFGQFGPAETAWRRSSDYAYAIQQTLALLRPAEYFATQIDTSRFYSNPVTGQFSNIENQKITTSLLTVNGATTSGKINRTSGYINWIADGIKNIGIDPVSLIGEYFSNFSVQLQYKVGGFTDTQLLTISAEQTSPGTTSPSVIIPDTNYKIYLNKSVPLYNVTYSAVVVEKTTTGYSVSGYDPTNPYFVIIPSLATNNSQTVNVSGLSVKIYNDSTNTYQLIPYGQEFATAQQVSDFLISYQRYLTGIGFTFNNFNSDLQMNQDFILSVNEFLYWAQQGWAPNNIIVLNPVATELNITTNNVIVGEITNTATGGKLLDQNYVPIKSNYFNILRTENAAYGNETTITTLNQSTICYAKLQMVQYEHTLIFDNIDSFGDIIYIPSLGTRQYRLKLDGSKTGAWSGALSAPGYVYSDPVISTWQPGTDYKLGDIVTYNNFYYTASQDIAASETFNNALWTQISKSDIQTGLLPNFALNAQELVNVYDVDNPPLNNQFQLYSASLIGFRERSYLTDLGLDITTQTKFYQGFIKEKGSLNSVTALTKANFNNVQGNISVYEEWAFRTGLYGGIKSNNFREFVLDQSTFITNPVAFTLSNDYSAGNLIVDLTTANIYNASNLLSTSTTIYSNRVDNSYMSDLPSVGYMNLNDIDYTIFDITTVDSVTESVAGLGIGSKIWVAKDSSGSWNVYRATETYLTATTLTYLLDNYGRLTFNSAHNFVVGDIFVLKDFSNFNAEFDGIYEVVNVIDALNISIEISNTVPAGFNRISPLQALIRAVTISNTGVVYSLKSARVSTVTDLINYSAPINGWLDNDHIWVDNATSNGWATYTYNVPWNSNAVTHISAITSTPNSYFGHTTRLSSDSEFVYVGSPGSKQIEILSNVNGIYSSNLVLTNSDSGFGTAIDTKGNLVAVGAPLSSNVHIYLHGTSLTSLKVLTSANSLGLFGTSITMSGNQSWLYVGEPYTGAVQAYWTANVGANVSYTHVASLGTLTGNFGQTIKTNSTGNVVIIGAPNAFNKLSGVGNVYVYTRTGNAFALTQTITTTSPNQNALFGTGLAIDGTGGNLYIGAPGSLESGFANGLVERWTANATGVYSFNEFISHPNQDVGQFGISISVSNDSEVLAVGSAGSSSEESTEFDNDLLEFDYSTTTFIDHVTNSGAVYLFEPLVDPLSNNTSGGYVYTQELETQVLSGYQFGSSIDVARNVIAVGAPGVNNNAGSAFLFENPTESTTWVVTRNQSPIVDTDSVTRTFLYNKTNNNILVALDFIDPAKGKVLNFADQDIDYKLTTDPAYYNAGTVSTISDFHWGPAQVGKIWWDLSTVRYINYEQDTLNYRLNEWGTLFPGSEINVYQWVESSVPPSKYVANGGIGIPLHPDDSAYCTYGFINSNNGTINLHYYFWVEDIYLVAPGKNNSVVSITEAIINPQSQGVPYATILRDDTIALYNVNSLITGENTIIHLGTQSTQSMQSLIHSEYALVQEGNPDSQLPVSITNKLIDSLAGVDVLGNVVPDPSLIPSQAYGISIRPRQSMIINQPLALSNYLNLVNSYLLSYRVVGSKVLTTLNSQELIPLPNSGAYNATVDTIVDLSYVDTTTLSTGYSILVLNDSSNDTRWAIYTWNTPESNQWNLSQVQSYKTNLYWSYADWNASGYNPTTIPDITVVNNLDYGKLTLTPNTYIKVLNSGDNNSIVYYIDSNLNQNIVSVQNGTIQISTDTIPGLELRQILIAMQTQIFIDDLAGEYNTIFFAMIKYILTEQKNLDWVFKTSFISAKQAIRRLKQFPAYITDNQDFYKQYIEEVKPYRSVIREFVVDYLGNDQFGGDTTDFDLPSYWDSNLQLYRSPDGSESYDANLLSSSSSIYSQWYQNYPYGVVDYIVESPGTGYTIVPQIIVQGGGGTGATAYATINSAGGIESVYVSTPGSGYTSYPTVIVNGVGTGSVVRAVLRNVYDGDNSGHNLVRSIATTIKFDRTSYKSANTFVFWDTITTSNVGQTLLENTIIVNNNNLYQLTTNYTIDANVTFPTEDVSSVNYNEFNTATDRITAFAGNIDLSLVADGLVYPGVIVDGSSYSNTEFDTNIQSAYTDNFGIDPTTVTIDGGAYYDTFNSHAPEELIPGQMFDSLNVQVFDTNHLAYRQFDNMLGAASFYRISAENTTTLTSDLALSDSVINIANGLLLPEGNPNLVLPGVVFINGEKITYYRNFARETAIPWTSDLIVPVGSLITYGNLKNIELTTGNVASNTYITTGNVFATQFSSISANVTLINVNSLGQIRRAVDGTGPRQIQPAGSLVVDSSLQQSVPGSSVTTKSITTPVTYKVTDVVTNTLHLVGTVSANVGDIITQVSNANVVFASMTVMQTVANSSVVAVLMNSGTINGLPELFDEVGFDEEAFDEISSYVYINGNPTSAYITSINATGMITANGTVTLSDTTVHTTQSWYSTGFGQATTGAGLSSSNTQQAIFLKASPGYTP
jgi:hypothetical protein